MISRLKESKNMFFSHLLQFQEKIRKYIFFGWEYSKFVELSKKNGDRFEISWHERYLCVNDATEKTCFDTHYLYHLAWAARVLSKTKPDIHIDISSSLHFCSMVSAFIPVKFFDFRPAEMHLSNLTSEHADLTSLPFGSNSIQSLSCMHTVEHIGLGRYGDPMDPDGDLKAIAELKRVLAPGGNLLFVVPVGGKAKIMFNAHRIYTCSQIITSFKDFTLKEFSLITDNPKLPDFIENADPELSEQCTYGCGCFWFEKK